MTSVHVIKQPDGWRVAIKNGHETVVLDNLYDDEQSAIIDAASLI